MESGSVRGYGLSNQYIVCIDLHSDRSVSAWAILVVYVSSDCGTALLDDRTVVKQQQVGLPEGL